MIELGECTILSITVIIYAFFETSHEFTEIVSKQPKKNNNEYNWIIETLPPILTKRKENQKEKTCIMNKASLLRIDQITWRPKDW